MVSHRTHYEFSYRIPGSMLIADQRARLVPGMVHRMVPE